VEESLRLHPIDGVVLLGTAINGSWSADGRCKRQPSAIQNAGPKSRCAQGQGSGTLTFEILDELRPGGIDNTEWEEIERRWSCGFVCAQQAILFQP